MPIKAKKVFNTKSSMYLKYGYLMFPLNLKIVSKMKIGKETFYSKKGYHISLIRLLDFPAAEQKKIFRFAKKYPVKLKEITDVYRLVKENSHQSIIVRVRLQGLRKMINSINNNFGLNIVYPPTHITLFTLKDMDGNIGVNSPIEYKHLTHQISQKDFIRLNKSFELI